MDRYSGGINSQFSVVNVKFDLPLLSRLPFSASSSPTIVEKRYDLGGRDIWADAGRV